MNVDLDGDFETPAAVEETFAFLTTPERFAPVLPYFKGLEVKDARHFTVSLEVGVPQIRGRADVEAELVEVLRPSRAVYLIKGRHALGMMDSRMTFAVTPTAAGAKVAWTTHSVVSGTLASLAQGILLPLAKRQIKSLVQAVRATLSGEGETAAPAPSLVTRGTTSLRGLFGKAGGS